MQQTAYEMRISDVSSDVCSSDLIGVIVRAARHLAQPDARPRPGQIFGLQEIAKGLVGWIDLPGNRLAIGLRQPRLFSVCKALRHVADRTVEGGLVNALRDQRVELPDHVLRSEERRVGKECVSTCRSGGSPV